MTSEEVEQAIRRSKVVITHGGAGLVSLPLAYGKRPLVLPRRSEHDEHVDNHQVEMTDKLDALGLVVSLERHPMAEAIALAEEPPPQLDSDQAPGPPLADRLSELVDEHLRGKRPAG